MQKFNEVAALYLVGFVRAVRNKKLFTFLFPRNLSNKRKSTNLCIIVLNHIMLWKKFYPEKEIGFIGIVGLIEEILILFIRNGFY